MQRLTLDDGHDGALLDSRRTLKTVGVDTTEELSLEVHGIERVGSLVVVRLDLACTSHPVSGARRMRVVDFAVACARGDRGEGGGEISVRLARPRSKHTLGDLFKTGSHDCGWGLCGRCGAAGCDLLTVGKLETKLSEAESVRGYLVVKCDEVG